MTNVTVTNNTFELKIGTFSLSGFGQRTLNKTEGSVPQGLPIVSVDINRDISNLAGEAVFKIRAITGVEYPTMDPRPSVQGVLESNTLITTNPDTGTWLVDKCLVSLGDRTVTYYCRDFGKLLTDQTLGTIHYDYTAPRFYGIDEITGGDPNTPNTPNYNFLRSNVGGSVVNSDGIPMEGQLWVRAPHLASLIEQYAGYAGLGTSLTTADSQKIKKFKYTTPDGKYISDAIFEIANSLAIILHIDKSGALIGTYASNLLRRNPPFAFNRNIVKDFKFHKTTDNWARSDFWVYGRRSDPDDPNTAVLGKWSEAPSQIDLVLSLNNNIMRGIHRIARLDLGAEENAPITNHNDAVQLATTLYHLARLHYRECEITINGIDSSVDLLDTISVGGDNFAGDNYPYVVLNKSIRYDGISGEASTILRGGWDGSNPGG